jgi:phosphoribosyl 1,2-cyclic phosphodiesterase
MQIKFIGTGSAGNCIAIQTESSTILIDIGIAKTKVEKALIEQDINPADIDAIFLTHAHGDHVKGLPMAAKWGIPVYASAGTWKTVMYTGLRFDMDCDWFMGSTHISNFKTHHDDYDSYGYVVQCNASGTRTAICLDTGHVDDDMIQAMSGSDIYIIEANHDVEMLQNNQDRPDSVKARILSDVGHLSNEQTGDALCKLVMGTGETIFLAHLSNKNNHPTIAVAAVARALKAKGLKMNTHYTIGVV